MRFVPASGGARLALLAVAAAAFAGGLWAARDAWDARRKERIAIALTGGDPTQAPRLIRRYGCGGCHFVPGVSGADGQVAGPLVGLSARVYIGGVAPNTARNLIRWITAPQTLSPGTAMPATGITEAEARDVAAYLYAR